MGHSLPIWYPPRPLPEHPSVLISKETARNKACQTRHIRYINWPEIYMNPNDTILTPNKKYKRTCKWTKICIQRKNEKDTQTDTEYKTEIANIVRHSTNTNTVSHVPSSPQTMKTTVVQKVRFQLVKKRGGWHRFWAI